MVQVIKISLSQNLELWHSAINRIKSSFNFLSMSNPPPRENLAHCLEKKGMVQVNYIFPSLIACISSNPPKILSNSRLDTPHLTFQKSHEIYVILGVLTRLYKEFQIIIM